MTPNQASEFGAALKTYLERMCVALERLAAAFEEPPPGFLELHKPVSAPPVDADPAATHPPPPAQPEAPSFTFAEVKAAILVYQESRGWEAAAALLAGVGAKFIKDIKPEQYAAIMAKVAQ
jgi:hypothetical protein